MKYMIVSDIHGSLEDLKKVFSYFEEENCDKLLILGDVMYHGPRNPLPDSYNPSQVAQLLNRYKEKIVAVRGNCDSEVDQMLLDFPIMSDYCQVVIEDRTFFLTHGHIYNEDRMPLLQKGDVFMYGHFHKPRLEIVNDIVMFNPSSITFPKEGEKSFGIYENGLLKICTFDKEVFKSLKI